MFEELEMDRDSLYLALAEKELEDCKRFEMRAEWQRLRSNDSVDSFTADAVANFFPRTCCVKHTNNTIRESLAYLKKSSDVRSCYIYVVRHTAAMISLLINLNLAVKVSTTGTKR